MARLSATCCKAKHSTIQTITFFNMIITTIIIIIIALQVNTSHSNIIEILCDAELVRSEVG